MQNAIQFFLSGGFFMYPLLIASILSLVFITERMISSFFWSRRVGQYVQYIQSQGKEGLIVPGTTDNFWQASREDKKKQTETNFQVLCEKRMNGYQIINSIGAVSPLLGFIGTIAGMIRAFQEIANADKVSIKLVAGGISEALITTGFGLIIAVICIFAESVGMYLFNNYTQSLGQTLEHSFEKENT